MRRVLVLPLTLLACSKPSPPSAAPASQPAAPQAGLTGAVSETAFIALHRHKEGAPPAPKGIDIDLEGSRAYLSLPAGKAAPMPGLVVIHEWWGLNDHIRHWSDRLASLGYAALAVDLYGGRSTTVPEEAMKLMKSADEEKARAILAAAHAFLASDPRIQAEKRGVIGWCFGGGWSLRHALATPDLDLAVVYYGHVPTDPAAFAPLRAEVLGIFGDEDESIPPEVVNAFEAALKAAGKKATILRFPANHAFANPSSARYDEAAATAAWSEVRAFLGARLR